MLLFKYKLYMKNDIFTLFREAFRHTGDKLIEICILYEEEVFPCGGGHCKGEGYAFVEAGGTRETSVPSSPLFCEPKLF